MKISFSASTLKFIAVLTMVIDHVGMLFFPHQVIWRVFGRISFPLFAFFIAEGYRRTSSLERYITRLFILGIFSQIPLELFYRAVGFNSVPLNILFTLTSGLIALMIMMQLSLWYSIPLITIIIFTVEFFNFEYGAYGVITVLASYLLLQQKLLGAIALSFLPLLYSVLSVPFVSLYNGKRGIKVPRYFLYWFYPVHLTLLWLFWLYLK